MLFGTIASRSVLFFQQDQIWVPEYMSKQHLSLGTQYNQSTLAEALPSTEPVNYWLHAWERKLCLRSLTLGGTWQGLRVYARSLVSEVVRNVLTGTH